MTSSDWSTADEREVDDILEERARALAVPRHHEANDDGEPHLITRTGDHTVAIPAARARHVVTPKALAHLMDCGPAVVGLAVVYGELVPVADLGLILHDGRAGQPRPGRLVVVDDGVWSLGLLVDDVGELSMISPGEVRTERASGSDAGDLVAGIAPGGAFVLDIDALLADPRLWPAGAASGTEEARSLR